MDTRLQALHADSCTPTPGPMPPAMDLALSASFGSVDAWHAACAALVRAQQGRAGWLLLVFQPRGGRLANLWVPDDTQLQADAMPLLALSLPAPAAHAGSGLQGIDWARVHARYQQAVADASDGLGVAADAAAGACLFDVRRAGVFAASGVLAAGAQWRDPALVDLWAGQVPAGVPVVVYCVHGHEVSRATALRLRAAGADAHFLVGGLDGWQAQGRPVVARSAA